jgi:hypothetical protein
MVDGPYSTKVKLSYKADLEMNEYLILEPIVCVSPWRLVLWVLCVGVQRITFNHASHFRGQDPLADGNNIFTLTPPNMKTPYKMR